MAQRHADHGGQEQHRDIDEVEPRAASVDNTVAAAHQTTAQP
jgi:hypothetical protein